MITLLIRIKTKIINLIIRQHLKNYYNDIMSNNLQPQQQQTVKSNYDLMANGVELSGELNNETIKRNLIKLLMVGNKTAAGNYTINKEFKPILLKHGLKNFDSS